MTTVLQIVSGAAEEIGVKIAETPLEAADFQSILNRMNDLLVEWADLGLLPQFIEVFNSTDTVAIPRAAVAAVKYRLAIRIAPSFERVVTQALVLNADDSLRKLETSSVFIGEVKYPDTLPTGSGNDCLTDNRFFEQNKRENF